MFATKHNLAFSTLFLYAKLTIPVNMLKAACKTDVVIT